MKYLYLRCALASSLWMMCVAAALAQGASVAGTVTDESGVTMPGVNVLVKGTGTGTATDANGRYQISVPDDASVLVFTFVGYATTEVAINGRSVVDIQLTPDVQTLTELVVTGYQVQRKADISGAVAVVDTEELQTIVTSSFAQKLAGRAPGITVSTSGSHLSRSLEINSLPLPAWILAGSALRCCMIRFITFTTSAPFSDCPASIARHL